MGISPHYSNLSKLETGQPTSRKPSTPAEDVLPRVTLKENVEPSHFGTYLTSNGEVTVEDKQSQQAHAKANKARVDEVAKMKAAAAQEGVATDKTAVDYQGATEDVPIGKYAGTVDYALATSGESWKGNEGSVEYLPLREGTVGYTPMKTIEKPEVPYNYDYAGSKEVRLEKSEMQKVLENTQRANDVNVEHFDDLNKKLLEE